jgi:photosystem II stability/assembly factor-like uncharacterized protein
MSYHIPSHRNLAERFRQMLVLLLLTVGSARAQWMQLSTPGFLTCILKTPSRILVGTAGSGLFSSTDNGLSWSDASTGLAGYDVSGLASIGQNIFVSTRGGGVFLSTNNGGLWSPVNAFLISTDIGSLAAIGETLFAGPVGYGAFSSADNGGMWMPAGKGIGTETVNVFFSSSSKIFAGTTRGVYLSVDGGKNWVSSQSGLPPNSSICAFASIGTLLCAGTFPGGVFISADNGASWSPVGTGIGNNRVTSLVSVPVSQGTSWNLVAGTATGGLFTSVDSGTTWTKADLGLSSGQVCALTVEGSSVFAAFGEGVRISNDGGAHWGETGAGLPTNRVTAFGFVDTTLFVGTSRRGVLASPDGGDVWTTLNQELSNLEVSSMTVSGTKVYIGTTGGSVFRRDTSDRRWISGGNALANLPILAIGRTAATLFAAAGLRGVFYSPDDGGNWLNGLGSVVDVKGTEYTSFAVRQGYIFGGSLNAGVFRSTDNAITWLRKNGGLGNLSVRSLVVSGVTLYAGTSAGVYRSNDDGESWQPAGVSLNGLTVTSLAVSSGTVIAGTSGAGVYVSTDQGNTWQSANQGIPPVTVGVLATDGERVYAATALGVVYSRSLAEMMSSLTGVPLSSSPPSAFGLLQNYPNPFNPSTTIVYRIPGEKDGAAVSGEEGGFGGLTGKQRTGGWVPGSGWVKLSVYDMLGREVAVLVNEKKEPGTYRVTFDARELSSGTYLCRMMTDNVVHALKVVIVR